MPQLDFSSLYSQILWLSVSFLLTFVTVSKFFVPKVQAILTQRSELIKENLNAAEKSIQEYRDINLELDNVLKKARLQATVLREQAYMHAKELLYSEAEKIEKMLLKNENKELERLNRYRVKTAESIESVAKNIATDVLSKLFAISNVSKEIKN